jgi:hypothetical protein
MLRLMQVKPATMYIFLLTKATPSAQMLIKLHIVTPVQPVSPYDGVLIKAVKAVFRTSNESHHYLM